MKARLTSASLYRGKSPARDDHIGATALEVARILARSTCGFEVLCACAGRLLAGRPEATLAAVRMRLQALDVLSTSTDANLRASAQGALDAAVTGLKKVPLSAPQQLAWFNWMQHLRGARPDVLHDMQATLHKFGAKTIHRHGSEDSVRNGMMRMAGKRLGPLRAATVANPEGMREWQEDPAGGDGNSMRNIVRSMVLNLKHVPSVRMADGHVYGLSTKQITRAIASATVLTGVPLVADVDLQASSARESFVEISRGPDGIRFFIGSSRKLKNLVAVGAKLGYEVTLPGAQAKASAGVRLTPLSSEIVEPKGLMLRIARRLRPDGLDFDDEAMYRKALQLVDHLFSESPGSEESSPEATWQRLAVVFHDDPDLSTGWIADRSADFSGTAEVSASLTPRVMQSTIGPELSVQAKKHYGGNRSHDESGRRVVRKWHMSAGHRFDVSLQLGLHASSGHGAPETQAAAPPEPGQFGAVLPQQPPFHEVQQVPQAPSGVVPQWLQEQAATTSESTTGRHLRQAAMTLMALEVPLKSGTSNHMHNGQIKLVEEDGAVLAAVSVFDVEYKHPADWENAILQDTDGWLQAFTEIPGTAGIEAARVKLGTYLALVEKNERPHDTYILRYRLRADAAASINLGNAYALSLDPEQDAAALEQIRMSNDILLSDRRSWIEAELKVRAFALESRSAGFDMGAKIQRRHTLSSEHDVHQLKAAPTALQRRDGTARRST